MAEGWIWALAGIGGAMVSALLTVAWTRLARARQWLDLPGDRRLHGVATPRGGGIGIALVALLAMVWLSSTDAAEGFFWFWSALGLVACAGGGLLDDLGRLHGLGKLVLQLLGAVLLAQAFRSLQPAGFDGSMAASIVVATVLLVNVTNFMDGSNGLVTVQAVLVVAGLLLLGALAAAPELLAIVVLAAALAFLPFNFPEARVFLGDVGSHALGYALALLVCRSWSDAFVPLPLVFLLLSALVVDASLTLAMRMIRGERFWQPHREHLYQWAVRQGTTHARVCLGYAAWTLAAMLLAIALRDAVDSQALAAWLVALLAASVYFALKKRWAVRVPRELPA